MMPGLLSPKIFIILSWNTNSDPSLALILPGYSLFHSKIIFWKSELSYNTPANPARSRILIFPLEKTNKKGNSVMRRNSFLQSSAKMSHFNKPHQSSLTPDWKKKKKQKAREKRDKKQSIFRNIISLFINSNKHSLSFSECLFVFGRPPLVLSRMNCGSSQANDESWQADLSLKEQQRKKKKNHDKKILAGTSSTVQMVVLMTNIWTLSCFPKHSCFSGRKSSVSAGFLSCRLLCQPVLHGRRVLPRVRR